MSIFSIKFLFLSKTGFLSKSTGIVGGLGSTLLEFLNDYDLNVSLKRLGMPDKFIHELGSQEYIRRRIGIDSDGIFQTILSFSES